MSLKVMTEVWESSSTKGGSRLVLLALADHANDDGHCHPSLARLARRSALCERNVQLVLRDLERRGELVTVHGSGRGHVNEYWVLPPATTERLRLEGKNAKSFHPLRVLEERVKGATERVQPEAERANSGAERVKPASPRTVKNPEEPSETTTLGNGESENAQAANPEVLETQPGTPPASADRVQVGTANASSRFSRRSPSAANWASNAWQVWLETHDGQAPSWLDLESWIRWLADLDERGSRVTSARLEEQLHRLERLCREGESQEALVARAIAGGWESFYPERGQARTHHARTHGQGTQGNGANDERYGRYR